MILVCGVSFSVLTTWLLESAAREKTRLRFERRTQQLIETVSQRIATYTALLRGGTGLFALGRPVTRQQFSNYVAQLELDRYYPGVQGIGFSRRLREPPHQAEEAMRRAGFKHFHVWPDTPRAEYHSIVYLEPLDRRNQAAIGYDMFTDPVRQEAMARARDTCQAAASGKVTLVQEIGPSKQAGFLIYVPVYGVDVCPPTVAERRETLEGFVYAPFRADDFVLSQSAHTPFRDLALNVYDGASAESAALLHQHQITGAKRGPRFRLTAVIDVAGRPWTLEAFSTATFERETDTTPAVLILVVGLALTVLLAVLTSRESRARAEAEWQAQALRESQQALAKSDRRLRRIIGSNTIGFVIADVSGRILEANNTFLRMVGYTQEDLDAGLNWIEITPPEYRALDQQALEAIRRQGEHPPFEKAYVRKDGSRVPVLIGTAHIGGPEQLIIKLVLDLTERKRAEDALQRRESVLAQAGQMARLGAWELEITNQADLNANTLRWSDETYRIFGYEPGSIEVTNELFFSLVHPDDRTRITESVARAIASRDPYIIEHRIIRADGVERMILEHAEIRFDPQGRPVHIIGAVQDITERKQAEEQIRLALKEKEVLLKEIHHRVKNNLQVISSLLSLQSDYLRDPQDAAMFRESQNRIRSMAMVHEQLYRSKDLARIDGAAYIRDLTEAIERSYALSSRVAVGVDAQPISLHIDTAIPCGLIVNELVANALEHAFPDGRQGHVSVEFGPLEDGRLRLRVADDGVGLPEHFDFEAVDSLGMRLVSALASQLDAAVSVERRQGTSFELRFRPLGRYSPGYALNPIQSQPA